MSDFENLIESKIREAYANGELDDLPLMGKPLPQSNLDGVPPELRLAYSMLKNAGCMPEELSLHQDIRSLRQLILATEDEDLKAALGRELSDKELRFNLLMEKRQLTRAPKRYMAKIRRRLGL